MNSVVIEGNLTRDPVMRYTPTGKAVTEFSIAVNEGQGEKRTTEYIDCVAWEYFAESVAEHARRGTRVTVTGKLITESWTDKQTAQKRKATKVKAISVAIHQLNIQRQAEPARITDEDLSDLPF